MSRTSEERALPVTAGAARPFARVVARTRARARARLGVTLLTDFADAEDQWRRFEAEAFGTGFQSFDWLSAWHAHAAEGVEPAIAFVSLDGETIMLAPFGIERRMGLRCLVWLGGRFADYKGPLVSPGFAQRVPIGSFPALWAQILRALPAHDFIALENQPALLGVAANPFTDLGGTPAPDRGYVFALPPTYEALAARFRPETRRNDRAKERKLGEKGKLEFRIAESGEEARRMAVDILDRKAAQLRAQGISSIFEDGAHRAAFLALAALPPKRRMLQVAALTLDGQFLSGSIAHVWKGRATLLVHTYEQTHARLSPGRLHMLKLMKASIEAGHWLYDLSVGHAAYKDSFCDVPMPLFNYVAAAKPWGIAAVAASRTRFSLKRAIKTNATLMGWLRSMRAIFGRR
ncbi:MAG: GNAT family N-acetyltransferase [Parvibaculum sp.]|uniref:GNAT family N-acetyltransferase n=1 Tax=Parvibaculum sp. TaxID=2024848 RepID=UPI00284AF660|nr:GNAT family N-acetyltransferase [Parvibaculum sp.]MDR3499650.1 GNAT family N-acetyltransferase [Parvibaculum sp.]